MNSICNHHVDYRLCQSRCTLGRRWIEWEHWEDEIEPNGNHGVFSPQKKAGSFLQGSMNNYQLFNIAFIMQVLIIQPMQLPLTKRKIHWRLIDPTLLSLRPEEAEKYLSSHLFITIQLFFSNSNQTNHHPNSPSQQKFLTNLLHHLLRRHLFNGIGVLILATPQNAIQRVQNCVFLAFPPEPKIRVPRDRLEGNYWSGIRFFLGVSDVCDWHTVSHIAPKQQSKKELYWLWLLMWQMVLICVAFRGFSLFCKTQFLNRRNKLCPTEVSITPTLRSSPHSQKDHSPWVAPHGRGQGPAGPSGLVEKTTSFTSVNPFSCFFF